VTDSVRLNILKIEVRRVVELELEQPIATLKCSNEIKITMKITSKNYNYNNNY